MSFALALMLQAGTATPLERIDLTVAPPCGPAPSQDEVVVCGRADGRSPYRLPEIEEPDARPPTATVGIGGNAALAAETESADVGGLPSNRVMVRLKIKF